MKILNKRNGYHSHLIVSDEKNGEKNQGRLLCLSIFLFDHNSKLTWSSLIDENEKREIKTSGRLIV